MSATATATATATPTPSAPPTSGAGAEIKITAEPTTSPATMRFVVDRSVLAGAARFEGKPSSADSPLAEAIFALSPELSVVQIREQTITLTKVGNSEWLPLARQVGAAIRRHIQSGQSAVAESVLSAQKSREAADRAKIEDVIANTVNPAVANHGGHVTLVDYRDGVVFVQLSGGCQGCASSSATLRMGIERMIRDAVPDIVDVQDVTDHTAGANPYYRQ